MSQFASLSNKARLIALLALALSFSAVPNGAFAQGSEPTAAQRNAARSAYAEGQSAFDAGNFADAEAAFEEAYRHIPNPVVLLGIAESREAAGDIPGAVEAFERYLADRPDADNAEEIRTRITAHRERPATLVIDSSPSGAAVELNGNDTGLVTPATLEVPAGTHSVVLRLEGHEDETSEVELTFASRRELNVDLITVEDEADALFAEEEEEDEEASISPVVWVLSGVAAASLITGTALGFMALSRENEFQDTPTTEIADQGERFALFADLMFGVAAVSAVSALVIALTTGGDDEDESDTARLRLTPVLGPTGGGLNARLNF